MNNENNSQSQKNYSKSQPQNNYKNKDTKFQQNNGRKSCPKDDRPKLEININTENYVDTAEKVMDLLINKNERKGPILTISKIRNLLDMTADIYNEVVNETTDELSEDICGRIQYLKVRFVYESGRDENVNTFVKNAGLLNELKKIGKSKKNYILFSRYMEALVAYHRYFGGREN